MLVNQYRILALLDKQNSKDHAASAEIVENGYRGLYNRLTDPISDGHDASVTREIHEILSMFHVISNSIACLSDEDKDQLALDQLTFAGFDANNDEHYHELSFMVDKMGLYSDLREKYLNSHSEVNLPGYRRQLAVFNSVRKPMQDLTLDDLKQIAEA